MPKKPRTPNRYEDLEPDAKEFLDLYRACSKAIQEGMPNMLRFVGTIGTPGNPIPDVVDDDFMVKMWTWKAWEQFSPEEKTHWRGHAVKMIAIAGDIAERRPVVKAPLGSKDAQEALRSLPEVPRPKGGQKN